jgi:hypothetical protein
VEKFLVGQLEFSNGHAKPISEKLVSETQANAPDDRLINPNRANIDRELELEGLISNGHLPDLDLGAKTTHLPARTLLPAASALAPSRKSVAIETLAPLAPREQTPTINPISKPGTPARIEALYNLDHRTSDAATPDAMVVIPPNFDSTKPINLMIYNHGWRDTASSSLRNAHLEDQMKNAPPNTVLLVPEWQQSPGSSGAGASDEGRFGNGNFVSGLVQEAFDRTPELRGKTLADVSHVGIVSHSAGYVPTESELYKNPALAEKVNSVTMLDSLYDGHGLDRWIHENIGALASGRKSYQNIFNTTTARNSIIQSQFVASELRKYGANENSGAFFIDYSSSVLSPEQLKRHSIVFRETSMPHMEIPTRYVAAVEASERS